MPEGDTIYRTARALEKALSGKVVTAFETGMAKLARVNDDTPVVGRTVERVEAPGEVVFDFLFGRFDSGEPHADVGVLAYLSRGRKVVDAEEQDAGDGAGGWNRRCSCGRRKQILRFAKDDKHEKKCG